MTDVIIGAIENEELTSENISFTRVRGIAGKHQGEDVHSRIGKGLSILTELKEIDQYLYAYGQMVSAQWNYLLDDLCIDDLGDEPITIVDHGCGQGLALLLLFDKFGEDIVQIVDRIILIEPSEIALERANHIANLCFPEANIELVNKEFDDLDQEDLDLNDETTKIHLMSNVLDVSSYDLGGLFEKMLDDNNTGIHRIFAISHDRNFNGGERLEAVYNWLKDGGAEGDIYRFTAHNSNAIGFDLSMEI